MNKKIKIKQVKSSIGNIKSQKLTLKALGLRRIGHERVFSDSTVIRGMINAVKHLVKVEDVMEGAK